MKIIGLIPARSGSKRVPGKNLSLVGDRPLLQIAIEEAIKADLFEEILVSTDWDRCIDLAGKMGVNAIRRPDDLCRDLSHDYEWVKHALDSYRQPFDVFFILRPTSPFRTAATIRRAWAQFGAKYDSLRAVSRTTAHPRKCWVVSGEYLVPYAGGEIGGFPAYDLATQALGDVYCQNGCLQIAWTRNLERFGNLTGERVVPFITLGVEGFDINTPLDLAIANWLMRTGS